MIAAVFWLNDIFFGCKRTDRFSDSVEGFQFGYAYLEHFIAYRALRGSSFVVFNSVQTIPGRSAVRMPTGKRPRIQENIAAYWTF